MNGTPAIGPAPRTHETRASARRAGFSTTAFPRWSRRVSSRETATNSASMATSIPRGGGSSWVPSGVNEAAAACIGGSRSENSGASDAADATGLAGLSGSDAARAGRSTRA